MPPDEDAIYTFCNELLTTKRVGDATYQTVKDRVGERGVVDLIGIVAYLSDGRSRRRFRRQRGRRAYRCTSGIFDVNCS